MWVWEKGKNLETFYAIAVDGITKRFTFHPFFHLIITRTDVWIARDLRILEMYQTIRDPVKGKMQGTIKEMSLFRLLQQRECSLKRNIKKIKASHEPSISAWGTYLGCAWSQVLWTTINKPFDRDPLGAARYWLTLNMSCLPMLLLVWQNSAVYSYVYSTPLHSLVTFFSP